MPISVSQPFERQGAFAIDVSLALTKAEMKAVNDNTMPAYYFTICQDDGKIYLYDKSKAVDANTGKFRIFEGGNPQVSGEIQWTQITGVPAFANVATSGDYADLSNTPIDAAGVTKIETDIAGNTTRIETLENAGYATEQYVDDKVAELNVMPVLITNAKPTANIRTDTIYLIPDGKNETGDLFEEWIYVNKGTAQAPDMVWEKIGIGKIDLTGYATETYVDEAVADAGPGSLAEALAVTADVGGYKQGDNIAKDTSLETIIRKILSKTYYPTYTAPSASLSYTYSTLYKVGATVPSNPATLSYNAGAIKIQDVKKQDRGGAATGYTLTLTGADSPWTDTNASSGSFTVPSFTKTSKGNVTLTGTVAYAQGPQPKDSENADFEQPLAAGNVSKTITMEFILPFYYGASNTANVTDFTGLTEDLKKSGQKSYTFTTDNQHMVIAYDAAYNDISEISDTNQFNVTSGWTKSTITVDGQSYKVYVADLATTGSGTYTFKF